ncbi:MAG: hypothetical protein AB1540_03410 [Bdellovibrionota bacterium]
MANETPKPQPTAEASEKTDEEIEAAIRALEQENKTLQGLLANSSAETLNELKSKNVEFKTALSAIEKQIIQDLLTRKIPFDATSISDRLQVLKAEVLAHCADRELDPALWKKLESL